MLSLETAMDSCLWNPPRIVSIDIFEVNSTPAESAFFFWV